MTADEIYSLLKAMKPFINVVLVICCLISTQQISSAMMKGNLRSELTWNSLALLLSVFRFEDEK